MQTGEPPSVLVLLLLREWFDSRRLHHRHAYSRSIVDFVPFLVPQREREVTVDAITALERNQVRQLGEPLVLAPPIQPVFERLPRQIDQPTCRVHQSSEGAAVELASSCAPSRYAAC